MKKEDFINTLSTKHVVKFGESEVGSHAWLACAAIASDLGELLAPSEHVLHGLQLSDFDQEKKWSGKVSWVLLLTTSLLELTVEMTTIEEKGQRLKVSHVFHPIERLVKAGADVLHEEAMKNRPYTAPEEARLVLDFGGVPLSIGPVTADVGRNFMAALLHRDARR